MLHCYVHIPFCRTRCPYCDFFLVTRQDLQERFFRALVEETRLRSEELRGRSIRSIHFGGGTPSLAPPALLGGWLETLARFSAFGDDVEVTLEANPEDLTPASIRDFRAIGVNRLSLGVQSFLPGKLEALGRRHTASDALRTTGEALDAFGNACVDLICGAEGETGTDWREDLSAALATGVPHISVYLLTLEKGTRLMRDVRKGAVVLPDESLQATMYETACGMLGEHGFRHYEVSNFSRPGFFSRYNLGCWHRESYLGFGPSAHSLVRRNGEEWRRANGRSLMRYLEAPGTAGVQNECLSERERINEQVFLSLRLASGLDPTVLLRHHESPGKVLATVGRFRTEGLLADAGGAIRATEKGFLFADFLARELLPG